LFWAGRRTASWSRPWQLFRGRVCVVGGDKTTWRRTSHSAFSASTCGSCGDDEAAAASAARSAPPTLPSGAHVCRRVCSAKGSAASSGSSTADLSSSAAPTAAVPVAPRPGHGFFRCHDASRGRAAVRQPRGGRAWLPAPQATRKAGAMAGRSTERVASERRARSLAQRAASRVAASSQAGRPTPAISSCAA
jgi:hypothetical protein